MTDVPRVISVSRLDIDIQMLEEYVSEAEVRPLLTAMTALAQDPENDALYEQMKQAYDALGIVQGAVLTYAHYLKALFSDELIWDEPEPVDGPKPL